MRLIFIVCLILIQSSCALPKQPALTKKEKELIERMELKCQCRVERSFSSSYLRYGKKGEYILGFKGVIQRPFHTYIADSGLVIAEHAYNELLNNDTNIVKITLAIIDSVGNNTYRNAYFEYPVDSLLITKELN